MASCWVVEGRAQEEPRLAAVRNPDVSDHKYSLLVIIGQIKHANQTEHITREIERGIRSWDVDLTSCNLNLHLKDFLSHHTLQILKGTGQRCLRYSSGVLDTRVLISPSQEIIYSEVCGLLKSLSGHKLLILAGQSWEDTGDLLIDSRLFSPHHLSHILTEQFTDTASSTLLLPTSEAVLTLSCPNIGQWKKALLESQTFQGPISLRINPPVGLPTMEALGEFTSLLTGTLTLSSPFDCLQPPSTVGFLKLSRPCCYVFPAGRGDCAFFAVNGFTILVDGGSDPQACFWKLVRHLDRVDAVLLTHIGTENLPGVNALLERKLAELEMGSDVKGDLAKRLISPEIGVVFFNAPSSLPTELQPGVDGVLRSKDQAALTLRLLKKLNITPQPLFRQRAATIEPLTLFQKMGVGRLELYVLNPAKQSPEYQTLLQNWPDVPTSTTSSSAHTPTQTHPVTTLASVCALLVWHPSCPQEKVVRVLFPGITPQGKVLDGLEKLRGLAFFQKPTITTGELEGWGELETREARQAESQDSGRSVEKEVPVRPVSGTGKDRGNREEGKKDGTTKEKNKVTNGNGGKEEFKKEVDKVRGREGSAKQKVGMSEKTIKKVGVRDVKKEEKVVKKEESGPKKKEPLKKEVVFSKPKNEVKSKPKKEITKNDPKTGKITIKPLKEIKTDSNVDTKKSQGASLKQTKANMSNTISKIESPQPWKCLKVDQNLEIEGDSISNMSTPEDIAADFISIRKEADEEEVEKKKGFDNGEKKSRDFPKQRTNESLGTGAENSVTKEVVSTVGGQMNEDHPMEGEDAGDSVENHDQPEKPPVKVVGFPSPLTKLPKHDCSKFQDLTPTEYTLLEGGLQESPPPRLTPENQCLSGPDPDEETVELASADSRPNSAGHTPYCLSPDDVWGCKDNESSSRVEKYSSPESLRHDEGQPASDSKTTANSREKRLSFLSLGSLKEGLTDVSPSVTATTTTTTHSLPAEVSSPQSTEVDESLSMSFEQGPTNVIHREGEDSNSQIHSNGSHFVEADFRVGMSLPLKKSHRPMGPGPNTLHFDSTAHDVDLCLVSPCEFKHFKTLDSSQQHQPSDAGNHSQEISVSCSHSNNNRDKSASESNAPLGTEDCPSTTADGVLDSDDESCSDPSNSFHDPPTHHPLSPDPSPVPLKDIPPLPPQPGLCMPVPLPDTVVHGKGVKSGAVRGKKLSIVSEAPQRPAVGGGLTHTSKTRTGVQAGAIKGVKSLKIAPTKPGSKAGSDGVVNVYVDLAYLPSGPASSTVDVAFFKRVRSSCYIISGDNPEGEGLMRPTLDALLDAKASWPESLEVTLIPTFESGTMQEWYQQTLHRQRELSVSVLGSNSTVAMQDETFPACKIEF